MSGAGYKDREWQGHHPRGLADGGCWPLAGEQQGARQEGQGDRQQVRAVEEWLESNP